MKINLPEDNQKDEKTKLIDNQRVMFSNYLNKKTKSRAPVPSFWRGV